MRISPFLLCIALMGCLAVPQDASQTRVTLATKDIVLNRPNTDTREALFRLQPDGTGTARFLSSPDSAQDIRWTLTGDRFCIETDEGLLQTFGCANLQVDGTGVRLAHTQSDSVVTGVFVAR